MAGRLTLDFLDTEASAGLAPVTAAALSLGLANSPWADRYFNFLARPETLQVGAFVHAASVQDWIRDGLMAVFFLVVGLEIKFEIVRGELSSPRRLATPVLAAAGGMIVPALVFLLLNAGPSGARAGWPIATPTDIAFALAAFAAVARGLPPSLRLFLLTLAIADDFGAVALIAVLYSVKLRWAALAGAGVALALLAGLSRIRGAPLLLYAAGFVLVWGFCLKSGISTSVAGVACAMTVPAHARRPGGESMLTLFMEGLHPWVAFGVLPLFAFAAAGFSLQGLGGHDAAAPAALGVAFALLIGKPLGVFGTTALAATLRIGRRPAGATWLELAGVAALCGVGFTMSLYLNDLAFGARHEGVEARLGVVIGSLASAALGMALLAHARTRRRTRGRLETT